MSSPILSLFTGGLAGVGFGAIYLALLWAAVRSLPQDRSGVLLFVGLGIARIGLLLAALAAAAALGLRAPGIAAAVAGFIAVRTVATRRLGGGAPGDAPWR